MIIFHIITHFDQGGAETVALNIAKSQSPEIEYHIFEVVRTRGYFREAMIEECRKSGIQIHQSPISGNKIAIVLFPFWFYFVVLKLRPSIIHTHTEIPDIAVFIFNLLFGWLFPNLKYVRTIHNTKLWTNWKGVGRLVETFFKNHNSNIAISKSVQSSFDNIYKEKPRIINNGVCLSPQIKFDGINKRKINVLFAGRFEYQKGVDELIEIVNVLRDNKNILFHIVGSGSMKWKIEQISHFESVLIYDTIHNLSSYLASFDFILMPSNFEGLCLLSIEASMAKVPSIINRCPGLRETLPEDWPLAVENNNIGEYIHLLSNIDLFDRAELGKKAYSFVINHFCVEKMQRQYEQFYKTLCYEEK